MKEYTKEQIIDMVEKAGKWRHTIDLGHGVLTPGEIPASVHELRMSYIPRSLRGKTVLDTGTWDGVYAFECERRGAAVTAIDVVKTPCFTTAKKIIGSNVKFKIRDLHTLPRTREQYDLVLFFGILYHMKNPLLSLEAMRSVTRGKMLLESYYIKHGGDEPFMKFFPDTQLAGDPTNWWGPNIPCILDMLRAAGFRKARLLTTYLDGRTGGRALVEATA